MGNALTVLINETIKGLKLAWSYRFDTLTMLFRLSLFFVLISLVIGGGTLREGQLAPMLLGYLVWFYAAVAISTMSWALMEEAQAGTLEQKYMSPVPSGIIMLGRLISALVIATSMVALIGAGLALVLGIRIPVRWEGLPVFALTMAALFGFGFMIAGATLVFKRTQQLANLAENSIMYLSGALWPVHLLPGWLETTSKALPTTQGIIVLRNVVLEGHSLASAWGDGSLVWLALHSAAYFAAGLMVFKLLERIAMRQGTLGQY